MPSYDELKEKNNKIKPGAILTCLADVQRGQHNREPFASARTRRWKVLPRTGSADVDYDDLYIVNVDGRGKRIGNTRLVKTTENLWEQA